MKYATENKIQRVLWYILIILSCYLLISCNKTVYIPVESIKTEYRDIYTRDSVYLQDSIFVLLKGDTVWIEKYKTLYRDRLVKDSIFINDTIRIPYPVEKIVTQNKIYWYQKILIYLGLISLFGSIGWFTLKK